MAWGELSWKRTLILGACLWLALVAGRGRDRSRPAPLRRALAVRGLDAESVMAPIAVDARMRRFAQQAVAKGGQVREQLQALLDHMTDPGMLGLTYRWGHTGTTAEVFDTGEANCLAFTNLYIGLARSVGIKVYYLLIQDGATYRKEGDLVIVSDHVAVGYGGGEGRLVIDLAAEPGADSRSLQPISDLTALALFYVNRGAEALRRDQVVMALDALRTALLLDGQLAAVWINYGVALRRNGQRQAAEAAYRQALEFDPRAGSALSNLASLLRREKRIAEAEVLETLLARRPGRNPFTYLALGDISLANGRPEEAARLYRRAIGLSRENADAWAALGRAALARGDRNSARRALKKARRRASEHPRIELLERALGSGG